MSLRRYTLLVTGLAASSLLVAWSLGLGGRDAASRWATLYGGTLAVLNAVAAYFLVVWSDRRPMSVFFRVVLWGTAGRMAALVGGVAAGIVALGLPRLPLVVSVLAYFIVFLTIELTILHRRVTPVPGGSR